MFIVTDGEYFFFFLGGKKPPNPRTNKLAFTKIFAPVAESVQY